jgi:hypothetical protein
MRTENKTKSCKDCRFFIKKQDHELSPSCTRVERIDPVYGNPVWRTCYIERHENGEDICGPQAKFFLEPEPARVPETKKDSIYPDNRIYFASMSPIKAFSNGVFNGFAFIGIIWTVWACFHP